MKKIYYFFVIFLMLSCSSSSTKYLHKAQYDSAIHKSVKKLRKNPSKAKEIDVLKQAYSKANQIDKDRINFLKTSGEANVWDDIYKHYANLKGRQELVKTLPDKVLRDIQFSQVNYDQEILTAKKKAAEYFYNHAIELLKRDDRHSSREAYYDLQRVKQLYPNYNDVDNKLQEALFKGTNNILFKIKNQTNLIVPKNFEDELLKISMDELNTQWQNYDTKANSNLFYDYTILLLIKDIRVSPEQVKEESHTEEKEIEDGFSYKLDAKGNVMKDTAGNDIKIPKIKIITCKVIETHQLKTAVIIGNLDYINNRTGQLIKTNPITAEGIFENHAAMGVGNLDALKPETRKKIGNNPLPFPSNPDLIMQADQVLKNMTKDIIWANKNILND